ncbi:MAG: hypothetical protein HY075_01510 [Deltaproteobacteria bacterium]|nr:hypothetical protein [Deltaproteobacteria bacterium]
MMKQKWIAAFAVCSALVGMQSSFAQTIATELPKNLVDAATLDEQIATETQVAGDDNGIVGDETELDRPGHPGYPGHPGHPGHPGNPGHGYPGHGYPRPWHPRPRPRPIPYPYPRPGYPVRYVTCYAQSPANGLTYSATDYYASYAQDTALFECEQATGYECVAQGCTR